MLKEVLDSPFVDPLKSLRLPRELNPNKKYSWMQKKEERMFAMKSSLEHMDAMELDFRMRLAEVQRQYKEKQRELVKLQRRRESELSSKPLLTSDAYELGAGMRKRHKGPEEEHDALVGTGKVMGRSQPWDEHEAPSDFMSQLKIKKKKMASDQEQLASKLDKALSLTKQDKLKSPFKFSDSCGGKPKPGAGCGRYLTPYDSLLGKDRRALAKGLGLSLKAAREGKHKRAAKARKMEVGFKARGQPKSAPSPFASEASSYSYNTDSEEEEEFLKDEWSAQGPSGSKLTSSLLCGMVAKSSKPPGGPKLPKRGLAAARTLKPKLAGRKQPFCLLLREVEARSSFSDSSEDSFDQGRHTLFFVSPCTSLFGAAPIGDGSSGSLWHLSISPTVGPSLSLVQLEAKQKARKKEERQSLMGTEFEYTDSESEVKVRKRSPAGLLRPKKGLGEPGPSLAPPVPGARGSGPTSPNKAKAAVEKGRKARRLRGPKEPGFEAGPEASDDDLWTRRRSERIFLHDASAAAPAPSTAPAVAKPSRCGKGGPLSPRKDTGRAKDRKDPRKSPRPCWSRCGLWPLLTPRCLRGHEHRRVCPFLHVRRLPPAESTQAESSQAEGSQAESSQAESTQAEGSQAKGTQAEGTQAEGSQAEGTQAEGSQAEGTQAEGSQAEGTQAEGSQAEGTQAEGSQAEGTQAEGSQAEGTQAEGSQAEGSQAESSQAESTQAESMCALSSSC
ncbi:Trinucleotide repeat-containing protein 18 protein [Myotis brandtii]|uniref:Trinucleotide repeat-containing protein 18 protein n=1 Tax=Myotis brandtii TaxID=109478 RepID=S7NEF1_MYOBR|nr:Trinucleotide repeat-containing protein 18 protein [Myotis brandtii]